LTTIFREKEEGRGKRKTFPNLFNPCLYVAQPPPAVPPLGNFPASI
jgi:hypothetical protein